MLRWWMQLDHNCRENWWKFKAIKLTYDWHMWINDPSFCISVVKQEMTSSMPSYIVMESVLACIFFPYFWWSLVIINSEPILAAYIKLDFSKIIYTLKNKNCYLACQRAHAQGLLSLSWIRQFYPLSSPGSDVL
jgi:hypothetical protein